MTLLIEYRVDDYQDWKDVFDRDPLGRAAHGATGHTILHDPDVAGHFLLALTFAAVDDARSFRDLPAFRQVWEMSGAGESWIVEQTEAVEYANGSRDR